MKNSLWINCLSKHCHILFQYFFYIFVSFVSFYHTYWVKIFFFFSHPPPPPSPSHIGVTKQYKKPKRPCPYCSELFCNLPRHLKRQHSDEATVKQAILHPDKKETIFAKLRKQGILNYNKKQTNANAPLMRERRQGNEELIVCSVCKGFYSKRKIYSHKKKCDTENAECSKGIPFVLPVDDLIISDEFQNKVILSFRSDAVGENLSDRQSCAPSWWLAVGKISL